MFFSVQIAVDLIKPNHPLIWRIITSQISKVWLGHCKGSSQSLKPVFNNEASKMRKMSPGISNYTNGAQWDQRVRTKCREGLECWYQLWKQHSWPLFWNSFTCLKWTVKWFTYCTYLFHVSKKCKPFSWLKRNSWPQHSVWISKPQFCVRNSAGFL